MWKSKPQHACPRLLSSDPNVREARELSGDWLSQESSEGLVTLAHWQGTLTGRQFSRWVWQGPLHLLQCHREPTGQPYSVTEFVFGDFSLWVACMVWKASPSLSLLANLLIGSPGILAPQTEAPGMPQSGNLVSSRFLAWSRCSQDFPLWPLKSLNTVRMMSSFILRISRLWCSNFCAKIKIFPLLLQSVMSTDYQSDCCALLQAKAV